MTKQTFIADHHAAAPTDAAATAPLRFVAPPQPVLMDDPSGLVLSGAEPYSPVAVTAQVQMDGAAWQATGTFNADEFGTVDTARDASLGGSYTGVDPFGLWWSGDRAASADVGRLTPARAELYADAAGRTANMTIERLRLAPEATVAAVREPGVLGLYARPPGSGPFPAVIAFGGSGGGLGPAAAWAPALASHGIAVLAIAYFGSPDLPEDLVRIDVEVVERAVLWLIGRPEVRRDPVAVMGASRGSELALLAGALLDNVGAVVAYAPSGVSWAGLGAKGPVDAPAWRFRGADIPYARLRAGGGPPTGTGPIALRPMFEHMLGDREAIRAAGIPVELVKGAVLMVSGEADQMWPSTPMAQIAERRAVEHGFGHRVTHLRYAGAGHTCGGVPGTPAVTNSRHRMTGQTYDLGGTPAANAKARASSWPQVVRFLLNQNEGPHIA